MLGRVQRSCSVQFFAPQAWAQVPGTTRSFSHTVKLKSCGLSLHFKWILYPVQFYSTMFWLPGMYWFSEPWRFYQMLAHFIIYYIFLKPITFVNITTDFFRRIFVNGSCQDTNGPKVYFRLTALILSLATNIERFLWRDRLTLLVFEKISIVLAAPSSRIHVP